MLINRNTSRFILVKLRNRGRLSLTIPVALNPIDEIMEVFRELIEVIEVFIPQNSKDKWKRQIASQGPVIGDITISGVVGLLQEGFNELRRHKGLRLVEVEEREFYVKVEFY